VRETDTLWEINLGPWEGRLKVEIEREDPVEFDNFWHKPDRFALPGAETFAQLQRRGLAAIKRIVTENRNRRVLVVSHGAMIKSILSHFDGRPLRNLWHPPEMHNCAHSIIEFGTDGQHLINLFAGEHAW
jgi:probable phosphoglycerate mutase